MGMDAANSRTTAAAAGPCGGTHARKTPPVIVELCGEITISGEKKAPSKNVGAGAGCGAGSHTMTIATTMNGPNSRWDSELIANATPATKAAHVPLPAAIARMERKAIVNGSTNQVGFHIVG